MSISSILNNATIAQDADAAKIFAEVLNNDLRAITKLKGGSKFEAEDALRISRIWAEYQSIDINKQSEETTKRTPVYQRPAATGAAAAV
ncbi:hypothetical protein [Neoaquamicrobium sediminum]|uniref:hypothetical protein n=1 Tax=Neoaquamicrobium sediminum TaxID=1849104 RepID=UPI001563ABB8|nr:hypothetical protein [Mesorhizobium sediminum]NRC54157.1 hypothetical protein [Mesorhizobium sediminum]